MMIMLYMYTNGTEGVFYTSNDAIKNETQRSVKVYPNPFTNRTTFYFSGKDQNSKEIIIYDVLGKKIDHVKVPSSSRKYELQKKNLKAGVYFYRILENGGISGLGKLVIQ